LYLDQEDGIIISDEFYSLPDFSFSPPPPDPEELIEKENETPPLPPSTQISTSYNPRKYAPPKKSEEEIKIQKEVKEEEKKEVNIFSNSNFNSMMEQMCAYLEKKYKLGEGLIFDLLKIFFIFI
jgi:hypothetical protein